MEILNAPAVALDEAIKLLIKEQKESCTILHCSFACAEDTLMRIWPSTFLVQEDGTRKKLIKAFKISIMPEWTICYTNKSIITFTLVFEGLTKSCSTFHMLEDIPEPNGFYTENINRNSSDIYNVKVFSDVMF